MATKETVRVITRGERVRARRGRTATILPGVLMALESVTFDGEKGVVISDFGPVTTESGKRGAVAGKIKSHWKALHGEAAPKLVLDWLGDENLPQVFVKV